MKKLLLLILLTSLICRPAMAQNFDLQLKAGTFILNEGQLPATEELASSLFDGKRHLLLQFYQAPAGKQLASLKLKGVVLGTYIPNFSYHAILDPETELRELLNSGVRAISLFQPSWKIDPALLSTAASPELPMRLTVVHGKDVNTEKIALRLKQLQAIVISQSAEFQRMEIEISFQQITALSAEAWLQWIEAATPDMQEDNLPGKTLTRSNIIGGGSRNLKGSGVIVGVWDGGPVGAHNDFENRLTNVENALVSSHATHVSGTIGGGGINDPDACGMAPKATLMSYDFTGDIPAEMGVALTSKKIVITNNSYTYSNDPCPTRGLYDSRSHDLDVLVNLNPYFTHVFAAGNTQTANCAGSGSNAGFRTVHSGTQAAKNGICVGAVDHLDAMSNFSCFGPLRDNRLKPEVVTVGVAVNSTYPNHVYSSQQGTSMASPNMAGIVAQIFERYRQLNNEQNPDAALVRNIVANTAEDLGNAGPDFKFGFGRVNALRAVRVLESNRYISDLLPAGSAGKTYTISVPATCKRMRIMITWNDPAGAASASPSLVNNLNLSITDAQNNTILPWVLSASNFNAVATRGKDSLNNIEQITIDNPNTTAGFYTINVGGQVNSGSGQKFFLSYEFEEPSIEVTYPAGGETLVPSTTETIRWDSRHVTGNVQIHYSLNAGQSWTLISSATAATARSYSWSVPSGASSSKAMIRVRLADSSVTDMSDTIFTILGRPSMSNKVCSGQVHISWGNVPTAIAYEPFLLVNKQFVSQGITSSLFHTFKNLNNGTEYWFAVRAIGADSVKGKMQKAVNVTPGGSSLPPGFTTDLPLQSAVCLNGNIVLKTKTQGAATLSRVWQRSTNGGGVWTTAPGSANMDSLVLSNVTNTFDQYQYRMNLSSSGCGNTVTTTITTLRVDTGLIRTSNPQDQTVCYGTPMTFSYGAISKSLPTSKWEVRKTGDSSWVPFKTTTDTSLTFTPKDTLNNYAIRVIASNGCVKADTSAAANIVVKTVDSSWVNWSVSHKKVGFSASESGGSSYHWTFGDGGTSDAKDTSHQYAADGGYTVCLTVSKNACVVTKCKTVIINTVGMEEGSLSEQLLEIYPNPASDHLVIKAGRSLDIIHIYDRLGREVISADPLGMESISISLQTLGDGVYFLRTGNTSKKIVVVR